MRKDGKFIGEDGGIPEGQGVVMAHLNECHELVEMVSDLDARLSRPHFLSSGLFSSNLRLLITMLIR